MELVFDLSKLDEWIQDKIDKCENLDLLKNDISIVMDSDIRKNFEKNESSSGEPWQEWSEATKKYRKKIGKTNENFKLQLNNDLYKSIDTEITSWGVKAGSIKGAGVKYNRIHQKGGMAGRNKKIRIPARPYLGIGKRLKDKIILVVKEHTE